MRFYLTFLALFFTGITFAQDVPGRIKFPATLPNPMDPNGDGYISLDGSAFSGSLDELQFELPFLPIQAYQPEANDNQIASGSCAFYELVSDPSNNADASYYYYTDPDAVPDNGDELIFFRFRLARYQTSSTAFSVLLDTDYKFGFTGPEADPNAITGNPGFELEIQLINSTGSGGGLRVYNVDGINNPTIATQYYPNTAHYQVSYALNQDPVCSVRIPSFLDLYLPFSALGILSSSQIRMVVATNENTASSLGGGASDIAGVDGNIIPDDDDQFMAAILNYSPIALGDPNNQAPVAIDATISLLENSPSTASLQTVSASDPNGNVLTYAITGGNSQAAFAINSATGEITTNNFAALDIETNVDFTLVVSVSDGKLSDNAIITINLIDVNEFSPTVSNAGVSINENSVNGTLVHQLTASDKDVHAVLAYSIIAGNTGSTFTINNNGQIIVGTSVLLDFESITIFNLIIRVSDGTYSDDAGIAISVTNVNEAPSASDATVTIDENSVNGTVLHRVTASDPDSGTVLEYSLTGGNTGTAFAIDVATGKISVNNSAMLNFESTPLFTITVRANDGFLVSEAIVTINLQNVNESPATLDADIFIDENLPRGTVVHQVVATDPDAGDVLTFSIEAGNLNNGFAIENNTGKIIINEPAQVSVDLSPVIEMTVKVKDRKDLSAFSFIRIELNNVPENTRITPLKGFSPDGDGTNDFWQIKGIEAFPDNHVKVYDRWGNLIFETQRYDNNLVAWRGNTNGKFVVGNTEVSESTYYFIIQVKNKPPITGYLIVKK